MAVLPFRLHGRTRIEQLRSSMQAALHAWLQGWSTDLPDCAVEVADGRAPEGEWWECRSGRVLLGVSHSGASVLGCLLAGVPVAADDEFAAAIGHRALGDLVGMVLSQSAVELTPTDAREVGALQARHGAAGFLIRLADVSLMVHLSPAACDALAPVTPPRSGALDTRREALLGSSLRLQAVIELGGADINAAATLRPGEIIKTSAIPDSVVTVRADDGTVLFRGVLESMDGRKALRCTSVELTQGND